MTIIKPDITKPPLTVVRVTRVNKQHDGKQDASDFNVQERYLGILVNSNGVPIESPQVGQAVFLAGDKSDDPWIFATDTIHRIEVYQDHWLITTEGGHAYVIENSRHFH